MNIIHNHQAKEVYTIIDEQKAYLKYEQFSNNVINITHTFVPKSLEGRKIASKLVEFIYEYCKVNNIKCIATCSYAKVWIERHQ